MKILFAEIPEEGLTVEIEDQSWFPDLVFTRTNKAYARMLFVKKGDGRVLLKGNISVDLVYPCDRCLEEYTYPINSNFSVDFELLNLGEQDCQEKEHACSESEMDVVFLDEAKIDVFSILEQQVYIAAPTKRLCRQQCKGLCPGCGVVLNTSPCECVEDTSKSPFAILARLKK